MELQKKLQALAGSMPSVDESTRAVTVLEQGVLALVVGGQARPATTNNSGGARPANPRGRGPARPATTRPR